jgi:hypothetical protein
MTWHDRAMKRAVASAVLLSSCLASAVATANMAQPTFVDAAKSSGVLTTDKTDRVRVARIDLDLDFREHGRGACTARYELESPDELDLPLAFVAAATVTAVTVDGAPVPFVAAKPTGRYHVTTPHQRHQSFGDDRTAEHGFAVHLRAGERRVVVVTFEATPGEFRERITDGDGLTRLTDKNEYVLGATMLDYPLWPAVGFGGGVGPIGVKLRVSDGARIAAPAVGLPATSDAALLTATIPERAGGSSLDDELSVREIVVTYPVPVRPKIRGSLFGALRVSSGDEKSFRPELRATIDLVVPKTGALSLGAQSDFDGTLAAVLTGQRGSASAYGSAYVGAGVVAFAKPGAAVGVEGSFGFRALVIPLDLALQVVPLRSAAAATSVGQVRGLVGLRIGF